MITLNVHVRVKPECREDLVEALRVPYEAALNLVGGERKAHWLERLKAHQVTTAQAPERFGGAIIRFTDPDGMPVLIAAGNQDPIVSAENSGELVALLRRAGADVTFHAVFDYLETSCTVNAYQFSWLISPQNFLNNIITSKTSIHS